MPAPKLAVSNAVLGTILESVRGDVNDMKSAMRDMAEALQKLTAVEQRQVDQSSRIADAFSEMGKLGKRVGDIETDMPGLREGRRWVVGVLIGSFSMMFVAVASLAFKSHAPEPNTYILERSVPLSQGLTQLPSLPTPVSPAIK